MRSKQWEMMTSRRSLKESSRGRGGRLILSWKMKRGRRARLSRRRMKRMERA